MRRFFLTLVLLGLPTVASAQANFTMTYDTCTGADGWADGAYTDDVQFTVTRLATGGPSSQEACQMAIDYAPGAHDFGGQFNFGWRGINSSPSQPSAGTTQYYKWRSKMGASDNFQCLDWSGGSSGNCTDKWMIVNDGCGATCRFIMTIETDRSGLVYVVCIQKDGGDDRACSGSLARGTWYDMQLAITWSTPNGTANGSYKLYIDNNTQASPTVQVTGIVINATTNPGYTKWGAFSNNGVESSGTWTLTHSDFTMSTTFDTGWDGGGGGGGGGSTASPYRSRTRGRARF